VATVTRIRSISQLPVHDVSPTVPINLPASIQLLPQVKLYQINSFQAHPTHSRLTSPDLTTKLTLRKMSNAPRHNTSPPGLSTAIIVAVIISGTVILVATMLIALCYVTNHQRGKAQREQEGVEMEVRGCELDVAGSKVVTESDSELKDKKGGEAKSEGNGMQG
jgi:hypothetical protein